MIGLMFGIGCIQANKIRLYLYTTAPSFPYLILEILTLSVNNFSLNGIETFAPQREP